MRKWNLPNLLYNMSETSQLAFDATIDDEIVELYDADTFINKIMYKYTSWCISSPRFYNTVTDSYVDLASDIESAITIFNEMYAIWKSEKGPAFVKLYEALRADYNPIWNVDGVTGIISEDDHTGTNVNARTGSDVNTLGGSDVNTLSGSDVNTLGGSDVNTLSGSDVNTLGGSDVNTLGGSDVNRLGGSDATQHAGTITDAHAGTITDGISITQDENIKTGTVGVAKSGTDTHDRGVFTFDDQSQAKKESINSDTFGSGELTTYNTTDAHLKTETDTKTLNNTDTETLNHTDTTTYGKTDTTAYGKTDTIAYGKTDTTAYGKTDTTAYGKTDTTAYGKIDTTRYGRTDTTAYGNTNTETRDLSDKHIELNIRQGNIGVTKTQELIESQLDLTSRDALIDYMIADFVHTNCII